MIEIIHGRPCVKLDGRYFAVNTKPMTTADKIAQSTPSTGNHWNRIQRSARGDSNKHVIAGNPRV